MDELEIGTAGRTEILPISVTDRDSFIMTSWSSYEVVPNSSLAPEYGFSFELGNIPSDGATLEVYLGSIPCESLQAVLLYCRLNS